MMSVCIWFNLSLLLMGNNPSPSTPLKYACATPLRTLSGLSSETRRHPELYFLRSSFGLISKKFSRFLSLLVSLARLTSSNYPYTPPHHGVIHHSTPHHSTPHPTLHFNPLATCLCFTLLHCISQL